MKTCIVCRTPKALSHFGATYNTCHICRKLFNALRQPGFLTRPLGYTKEEAHEKLSYGITRDGKAKYWTDRLRDEFKDWSR